MFPQTKSTAFLACTHSNLQKSPVGFIRLWNHRRSSAPLWRQNVPHETGVGHGARAFDISIPPWSAPPLIIASSACIVYRWVNKKLSSKKHVPIDPSWIFGGKRKNADRAPLQCIEHTQSLPRPFAHCKTRFRLPPALPLSQHLTACCDDCASPPARPSAVRRPFRAISGSLKNK